MHAKILDRVPAEVQMETMIMAAASATMEKRVLQSSRATIMASGKVPVAKLERASGHALVVPAELVKVSDFRGGIRDGSCT